VLSIESAIKERPAANMYFLDSSDENCLDVKGWGCIYPDQVDVSGHLQLR
jgi:hypothetical protein